MLGLERLSNAEAWPNSVPGSSLERHLRTNKQSPANSHLMQLLQFARKGYTSPANSCPRAKGIVSKSFLPKNKDRAPGRNDLCRMKNRMPR